jgi:parallel beta-helix repeat protein
MNGCLNLSIHSVWQFARKTLGLLLLLLLFNEVDGTDGALVIWHSQPVKPGQTVLLYGDALADVNITAYRLDDAEPGLPSEPIAPDTPPVQSSLAKPLKLIQPRQHAVKAVLPSELQPGVFAMQVRSDTRAQTVLINSPQIWWARGAETMKAHPGGEIRVFGLCLGWAGIRQPLAGVPPLKVATKIFLKGPTTIAIMASEADLYSARALLPPDMPAGDYDVWLHNGCGGPEGWGKSPQKLVVAKPDSWPTTEFNVLRHGARGDGKTDETDAVQKTLDKAGQAGGGIVYFPPGEYRFSRTLVIPRRVIVRGANKETTLLYWMNPHFQLIRSVIRGECHFGLENLTIWYVGAQYGINNMAEVDKRSGGGNVLYNLENRPAHWQEGNIVMRNLVVRWQPYVGRPGWGQLNDRLELYRRLNASSLDAAGKGVAVWLCGRDIRIEDCDIMSGGFPLLFSFFSDGSVVRNNKLHIGSGGLVWASRGRQCIWENNQMLGGETSRAGWSTKANPYYDQNYVRGNTVSWAQTADYEIFGSDGSSPVYYGAIKDVTGTKVTLAKKVRGWNWEAGGHLVFVLHGKGKGQARWVIDGNDNSIEIDHPWTIPLDETSLIGINHSLRQWLIVGNRFADGNSMQLYGLSYEILFAENELERVGGSEEASLRFLGFQHVEGPEGTEPSYFSQMLGNRASGLRLDSRRFQSGGSAIELHGGDSPREAPAPSLMNGSVLRGNLVRSGPIRITTGAVPTLRAEDILIEDNTVTESAEGIYIGDKTAGIALRNNRMDGVRMALAGPGVRDVWIEDREKAEYEHETIESILRRLSVDPSTAFSIRKDAVKLSQSTATKEQWNKLKSELAAVISQSMPAPHHPELARVLFHANIQQAGGGSLQSILEQRIGGQGNLDMAITNDGSVPLKLRVDAQWPTAWQGLPGETTVPPGATVPLPLVATLPKGEWGNHTFPARISLISGNTTLSWEMTLSVGSGIIDSWRILGPELRGAFRNQVWSFEEVASAADLAFLSNRPHQWNFSTPVRIGDQDLDWKQVTSPSPLALSTYIKTPSNMRANEVVGAYALCEFEVDTELWIEWTAIRDGSSTSQELQFFLDGQELWDLRLGRESWSPKRLPMKLPQGRHVMLVRAQDKNALPEVHLRIRELELPAGGHIQIISN